MSQTYHLLRRNGVWSYRRRVPTHLVETFGKEFIQFSLATRNLKEAQKRRAAEDRPKGRTGRSDPMGQTGGSDPMGSLPARRFMSLDSRTSTARVRRSGSIAASISAPVPGQRRLSAHTGPARTALSQRKWQPSVPSRRAGGLPEPPGGSLLPSEQFATERRSRLRGGRSTRPS